MESFQAGCEDPEAGEEPTHQPSVAILAQAQQGGCPIGPRDTFFPDWASAQGSLCVWYAGLRALGPTPDSIWAGGTLFVVFYRGSGDMGPFFIQKNAKKISELIDFSRGL